LPQEDNTSAVVQEETQEETQAAAEYDAPQGQPESKEIDQYTQLDQFDGEHAQEDGFPHDDQAKTHEDQNEDHYDSEGQQSESTATVAPLSGEAETTEQIEDVTVDAADANDDENSGLDDYYNDEDNGFGDDQQNFHDEFDGENNDAGAQEPADHAPGPDEDGDELDAAPTDEVVSTDAFNNAEDETFQDQTESTLNGVPKDAAAKEQTPDHADDLLEIAPDVLQTPAKDIARESLDQKEGVDSGEPEHNLAHNEGADEQHFNDDHFGQTDDNLEEFEAVVLAETDHSLADSEPSANLSAKRSREDDDDDEWDLVETTIDTKRRRS
jgi:hypothetical protein